MEKVSVLVCTCGRAIDDVVDGCKHCRGVEENRTDPQPVAFGFWILYAMLFACAVWLAWSFGG